MVDTPPTLWDKANGEEEGWLFVELRGFSERRDEHFGTDDHYAAFQASLAVDPERGDVMPGCGGLRKTRHPDPRRGKGKRGGLRVIYLLIPEVRTVVLVDVYDKGQADDLAPGERKTVSRLAKAIRKELMRATRQGE